MVFDKAPAGLLFGLFFVLCHAWNVVRNTYLMKSCLTIEFIHYSAVYMLRFFGGSVYEHIQEEGIEPDNPGTKPLFDKVFGIVSMLCQGKLT